MGARRFIPAALYKKILAAVPIPCVDVVIANGRKFLLVKRKNKPAQRKWWFIGGRIFKGETLQRALRRKLNEESDIKIFRVKKLLAAQETIFKSSAFGVPAHTVNSVFLVETKEPGSMTKHSDYHEFRWFTRINKSWPLYVKKMLRLAGFK